MNPPAIFLRDGSTYIRVLIKDIIMVEANGNGSDVWVDGSNIPIYAYKKIGILEERLPGFIRCHKGYLINPAHIWKFNLDERWVILGSLQMKAQIAPSGVGREKMKQLIDQ